MPTESQEDITLYILPAGKTPRAGGGRWAVKKWLAGVNQGFTIKEYDETSGHVAKNVSGYTVTVKAKQGTTTLISGEATIANATLGHVYYTVKSGDFPYVGRAEYGVELTMSGVKLYSETYPLQIGRVL